MGISKLIDIAKLRSEINSLNKEKHELISKIETLNKEKVELQNSNTLLQNDILKLKSENINLIKQLDSLRSELDKEKHELISKIETLNKEKVELQNSNTLLQNDILKLKSENINLIKQLDSLRSEKCISMNNVGEVIKNSLLSLKESIKADYKLNYEIDVFEIELKGAIKTEVSKGVCALSIVPPTETSPENISTVRLSLKQVPKIKIAD